MVPADLNDFLIGAVTASSAFIGLLFVAMSLIADKSGKNTRQIATENILAESAYIALLNVFFVSLVGLVPKASIGIVTVLMAALGLANSQRMQKHGLKNGVGQRILTTTSLTYVVELAYGVYIVLNQEHVINITALVLIVCLLFASALGRAWQLTGITTENRR